MQTAVLHCWLVELGFVEFEIFVSIDQMGAWEVDTMPGAWFSHSRGKMGDWVSFSVLLTLDK